MLVVVSTIHMHMGLLKCMQASQAEDICWVLGQSQKWVFLSAPCWLVKSAAAGFDATYIPNENGKTIQLQPMSFRYALHAFLLSLPV